MESLHVIKLSSVVLKWARKRNTNSAIVNHNVSYELPCTRYLPAFLEPKSKKKKKIYDVKMFERKKMKKKKCIYFC